MAKTLKTILTPGSYEPASKGDKDFEKQHTVAISDYRAEIKGKRTGSSDDVFNASKTKKSNTAVNKDAVTESALEVAAPKISASQDKWHHEDQYRHHIQSALDSYDKYSRSKSSSANEKDPEMSLHHGHLATHYKKAAAHHMKMATLHAKKLGLNEEVISELSKKVLGSYVNKAHKSGEKARERAAMAHSLYKKKGSVDIHAFNDIVHYDKKADKRSAGITKAVSRLTKEEAMIAELSNEKLKSYSSAAHASANKHLKTGFKARSSAMGQVTNGVKTRESRPNRMKLADKIIKKGHNRSDNASKADRIVHNRNIVARAAKEDAEYAARRKPGIKEEFDLSEAAKKKLKSAVKKKYLWKNNKKAMRDANS